MPDEEGDSKSIRCRMPSVTPGTINTHLDNIYDKLNCSNRLAACFTALKHGLIVPTREVSQTGKK